MTRLILAGALLALAGCSSSSSMLEFDRVCEDVEPFRPIIRGAVDIATDGATLIPFAFTSRVSCADAEEFAERLRDQR